MIRFDRVTKRYPGGHEAIAELSLEIPRGSMTFVTGHSGAGKSTLLKLIALLERPTRGQILIDGQNIARLPARAIPRHRRRIGMIFQDHRLLHDRTVFDNVALPLVIAGTDPREIPRRVRAALDRVGLLRHERARPITLSSGEQQRVGIARAVVNRPDLLLADEPTGNLDPELSREIMRLFERFNEIGTTILIASHDLALIRELRHPVIRLQQGRLAGREAA